MVAKNRCFVGYALFLTGLLFLAQPDARAAASLMGEQVTLTVTCTGTDSSSTPYNINLYSSTFTVGAGVEVYSQPVSGSIPNPGFPALSFSGTITVDVGSNTMSVNYTGTQPIGSLNYSLSSVTDQSASSISSVRETLQSGFSVGINRTLVPTFNDAGNGSVTAQLFCNGIQPRVNLTQSVSFDLVPSNAPDVPDVPNVPDVPAGSTGDIAPVFSSGPTATPNPAVVDLNVIFSAATLPADAEIKWDFGDGSPSAIGGTANHAYTAAGTYTVNTTARNIQSNTTATTEFQLPVNSVGSAVPPPDTILPLLVHGYLLFGGRTDQIIVQASLPATTFASAANATVTWSVNGVTRTFMFDNKGHFIPNGDRATVRVFERTAGSFEFYANIKGNLNTAMAAGVGLDANGHPKIADVQISAGGKNYRAILPVKLSGGGKGAFGFAAKQK